MEQTISVKNFLVDVDQAIKQKELGRVKEFFLKLSDEDLQIKPIKKRMAIYYFYNGEIAQSIRLYEELLISNPDDPDIYTNAFKVYKASGQIDRAYQLAGEALDKFQDNLRVAIAVCALLVELGESTKAANLASRLLAKHPDELELLLLKADSEFAAEIGELGRQSYETALELVRKSGDKNLQSKILTTLIPVYYKNGKEQELLKAMQASAQFKDRQINQDYILIEYSEKVSRLDEMIAYINEGKKNYPNRKEFNIYEMAYLRRIGDYEALEKLIKSFDLVGVSIDFKIKYHHERAKFFERQKDYTSAYDDYSLTNQLVIEKEGGSIENGRLAAKKTKAIEDWDALIAPLGRKYKEESPEKLEGVDPIFFVGFPRSGTTLIDQILTSHSDIEVIEERPIMSNIVKSIASKQGSYPSSKLLQMGLEEVQGYRKRYFDVLDLFTRGNEAKVVNKLPLNILHLPLIYTLFPKAKVIVALRHPVDSCLSCFFQVFGYNPAMANFVSMRGALGYYDKVMGNFLKFREEFGAPIHMVRYEDLTQDLEQEARAMLEYLEVPWEERVLRFYETAQERVIINTPSYTQVTQPIYRDSTYKWKNYEKQLAPLVPIVERYIDEFGYSDT